jgi:hypothetical protein
VLLLHGRRCANPLRILAADWEKLHRLGALAPQPQPLDRTPAAEKVLTLTSMLFLGAGMTSNTTIKAAILGDFSRAN